MKLFRLWVIGVVCLCIGPDYCLAKRAVPSDANPAESYPLLDEAQTPETKTAKLFLELICTSNMFKNQGTIRAGRGNLEESVSYLSKHYLSKVTAGQYLDSFENEGDFKLLQLYSSNDPGNPVEDPRQKQVFFEMSLLVGDEPAGKGLFLGGAPPETTGASARNYYGFITFVEEDGSLKVDQITYETEFPLGGGHQPWREEVDTMGQLAMGEGFSNGNMDASNCDTREVHPGRLAYVTCTTLEDDRKKTAKMVYPIGSAQGWICIQVTDETPGADKTDPLFLGENLAKKKEFDKAILEYQNVIDMNPDNFRARELMGYAYFRMGKISEAIKTLKDSIAAKPTYPLSHYNLALAYWANGEQKLAILEVRLAINLNPDYREVIKNDPQFKAFESSDEFKKLMNP